jgi:heptosyltransferase-2
MAEEFDQMHCYDKEDAAIGLATLIKAKQKFGFCLNEQGQMAPLNAASEYCFDLGLSDDLKFNKNKKSYQEVTYDCSELKIPAAGMDPYHFRLLDEDRDPARFLMKRLKWDFKKGVIRPPIIGMNTGSGRVFKTKQWSEEYFIELGKVLRKKLKAKILLLGGEDEDTRNKRIAKALGPSGCHYPGGKFSIRQFSGLIELCDLLLTGDTLAMHLALAMGVAPVVLFGSTCDQEVELYGLGQKLVSRPPCAPCYKNECDQLDWMKCMNDLTPAVVYRGIVEVLEKRPGGPKYDPEPSRRTSKAPA